MKKLILLATASLLLAACDDNEDNQLTSGEALQITATIGESTLSRAADDQWSEGDQIGIISTIGGEARPYVNIPYTYTATADGSKFTGTTLYYFKPMTLTAYYPFTDQAGTLPGDNGIISATTDADSQDPKKQPAIDFLWDIRKGKGVDETQSDFSASEPKVNFVFSHKMSKLSFTFVSSKPVERNGLTICDGVDVRTIVSYSIEGLGIEGTFDTATGDCALVDNSELGLTIGCEKLVTDKKDFDFTTTRKMNPLIVFPQVFQQTQPDDVANFVLVVTTDEFNDAKYLQKYKCQLPFNDKKIEPGYHYNFSVQVTKMGLIVGDMVIEPWINSVKSLTATIDGDPDFQPTKENQ